MSILDLNKAEDFAKLTLSSASSLLNTLTGLNKDLWDIQEGAYGHDGSHLVLFHVFKTPEDYEAAVSQVQDNISRRVIPFEFPYVDGQTTDDLGRNGESFTFDILLFGTGYYAAYKKLIAEFNNPLPGTLVHPIRGRMQAKFKEATVTHKSDARQAVALRVTFVEHNFEISFAESKPTTKSAIGKAVAFISSIANIVNKIDSNLAVISQLRASIKAGLASYQSGYTATLSSINSTFNGGSSQDLPSLLPNNQTPNSFPSAEAPNDPFSGVNQTQINESTSQALAALQATDKVKSLRDSCTAIIEKMESAAGGEGALIFFDDIQSLTQSALALQSALEAALQSSNAQIRLYSVPAGKVMSLREVCFANGLTPDSAYDLELLNPNLTSTNYIEAGTVLQVPTQ